MPCAEFSSQERANNHREIWQNIPLHVNHRRNIEDLEELRRQRERMANAIAGAFARHAVQKMEAQEASKGFKERVVDFLYFGLIFLAIAILSLLMASIGYGIGCATVYLLGL